MEAISDTREPSNGKTLTQPRLQWKDLDGQDQVFPLTDREVVVGRKADAEIVLDNAYISRRHAKITRIEEGYSVADLGSAFGTYVNDQRIEQQDRKSVV